MTSVAWDEAVTSSRQSLGDDTARARSWSVDHARALAAAAGLYRDQRERGSTAERAALLAAGAAAADQILSGTGNRPRARVDPAVIGELGDRSLDGLAVLVRRTVGSLVVESMLDDGTLPSPSGTCGVEVPAATRPGWDIELPADSGPTVAARVVISETSEAVMRHFAEHHDVPLVYASSDAVRGLPSSITVVPASTGSFGLHGPTVVDIGIEASEIGRVLAPSFGVGSDVVDAVPVFALGLIAARATRRLLTTPDDAGEIGQDALSATSDVFLNRGVGQLAAIVTGAKVVVAPVAVATGIARKAARRSAGSVDRSRDVLAGVRSEIARIADWYVGPAS
jgi:hypothetical protein